MATTIDTLAVRFEAEGQSFDREMNNMFGPGSTVARLGTIVAGAAVAAGAAITTMVTKGLSEFNDFEHSMAGAFRNIGDTSADMEAELIGGVRNIATEYGIGATEIAAALAEYAYAGLEVEDALWSVEMATRGAIAADSDLMDTLNKMEGIWAAFKGQGYEVEDVMDVLTAVTSNAVGGFESLSDAIVGAAAPAMNSGLSLEELGASIGALTWLGVPAAEASTRIRTALQELNDTGTKVGERFVNVAGVSFKQFIEAGGTLQEALELLNNDLDEGEDISQMFGSSIAGNAVSMFAAGEGADYYIQILGALQDSAGATDEAFERMSDTNKSSMDRIKANMGEIWLVIGERFAPAFRMALDAVEKSMPAIREIVTTVFDGIAAGVTWVQGQFDKFGNENDRVWNAVVSAAQAASDTLAAVFDLLAALWTVILKPVWDAISPAIAIIFDAVVDVITGAWTVIRGIFEVITGVLTGDWQRAWEGMQTMMEGVWTAVSGIVEGAWEVLEVIFNAIMTFIAGPLATAWNEFSMMMMRVWGTVRQHVKQAWDKIQDLLHAGIQWVNNMFVAGWATMHTAVVGVWDNLRENIFLAWAFLQTMLENAIEWIETIFTDAWKKLKDDVQEVWDGIREAVRSQWDRVLTVLEGAIEFVAGVFSAVWEALSGTLASVWETITGTVTEQWAAAEAALNKAVEWLKSVFEPGWEAVQNTVTTVWTAIETLLNAGAVWLRTTFGGAWEDFKSLLTSLWDDLQAMVADAWEAVEGILLAGLDWLKDTFEPAWDSLRGFFTDLWEAVEALITGAWGRIVTWLTETWNSLAGIATTAWSAVVDAILGVFDGMVSALQGVWDGVVETVRNAVNSAIEMINSVIEMWNGLSFSVPSITIPGVDVGLFEIPETTIGGQEIHVPQIPTIPMLATGGIVDDATLAIIGESGPEAVIPLDQLDQFTSDGSGGDSQTIIVELDSRTLLRALAPKLVDEIRIKTGLVGI